jgi:LEA14-like dessication related protein
MRRVFGIALMLLLVASIGMVGCAKEAKEIKPVEIEMAKVYPDFAGVESIALSPLFSISNPNDFEVTLDTLEYSILAEGKPIALRRLPQDVYIPANAAIELKDSFVVPLKTVVEEREAEGMSSLDALLATVPEWRVLGGKKMPAPLPSAEEAVERALEKVLGTKPTREQVEYVVKNPDALKPYGGVPGARIRAQEEIGKMITKTWEQAPKKGALFEAEGTAYITSEQGESEVEFGGLNWQAEAAPDM